MARKNMSKREKQRREQEKRKTQAAKPRKTLSPAAQAKDNESREAYMTENYTRIRDGVDAFNPDFPDGVLLMA